MAIGRFNCIVVVDALPEDERSTAVRLHEELRDIAAYESDVLKVRYIRAETFSDLKTELSLLHQSVLQNEVRPWLHFEAHGYHEGDGFQLGNGAKCGWRELITSITPINVAMGLDMMLVMASCYGGTFIREMRTTEPAPVLGIIGPCESITNAELSDGFLAFYRTFVNTDSLKSAIDALNKASNKGVYFSTTAEEMFYEAWAGYKENYCSRQALAERSRKIYRKLKHAKIGRHKSIGSIKRLLKARERSHFDKYRDMYFMYDTNPENKNRFPVTYEQAEKYYKS